MAYTVLLLAGVAGGIVNAIAGGATLITFPAMLMAGIPPILANASNAVAISPGHLMAAIAARQKLPDFDNSFAFLVLGAILGGSIGASALGIVTVFYMLVAIAALSAQPAKMFAGQEEGLAVILKNVTGKAWPALVLSAGAVISVFSVTLVTIYGQTRILYAIAKDGLMPQAFRAVNPRTQSPVTNTLIVSIAVGTVAGLVDSTFLWDMVSMGTLVAFIVVSIAVPVIRRKQGETGGKGFRVPFGPYLVPGLSIFACLYLASGLSRTTYRLFGIWMMMTVFTYFGYGIRNSRLNTSDTVQAEFMH